MQPEGASSCLDDRHLGCRESIEQCFVDGSTTHALDAADASRRDRLTQGVIERFQFWLFRSESMGASTPIARTFQSLARLMAWSAVLAIAILSLVPGALRPHTFLPGETEHCIAYAVAGFFLAQGYRFLRHRLQGWLMLAAASSVFEILQNFVPDRSPHVLDALASTSGLTLGLLFGVIVTQENPFKQRS